MLRSLYFKLDDQNKKHKDIIDFFNVESKELKKIDVLHLLITTFKEANDK